MPPPRPRPVQTSSRTPKGVKPSQRLAAVPEEGEAAKETQAKPWKPTEPPPTRQPKREATGVQPTRVPVKKPVPSRIEQRVARTPWTYAQATVHNPMQADGVRTIAFIVSETLAQL